MLLVLELHGADDGAHAEDAAAADDSKGSGGGEPLLLGVPDVPAEPGLRLGDEGPGAGGGGEGGAAGGSGKHFSGGRVCVASSSAS